MQLFTKFVALYNRRLYKATNGYIETVVYMNFVLWLPKQLFLSHYVIFVNFIHGRSELAEIDRKVEAMRRKLFGESQ